MARCIARLRRWHRRLPSLAHPFRAWHEGEAVASASELRRLWSARSALAHARERLLHVANAALDVGARRVAELLDRARTHQPALRHAILEFSLRTTHAVRALVGASVEGAGDAIGSLEGGSAVSAGSTGSGRTSPGSTPRVRSRSRSHAEQAVAVLGACSRQLQSLEGLEGTLSDVCAHASALRRAWEVAGSRLRAEVSQLDALREHVQVRIDDEVDALATHLREAALAESLMGFLRNRLSRVGGVGGVPVDLSEEAEGGERAREDPVQDRADVCAPVDAVSSSSSSSFSSPSSSSSSLPLSSSRGGAKKSGARESGRSRFSPLAPAGPMTPPAVTRTGSGFGSASGGGGAFRSTSGGVVPTLRCQSAILVLDSLNAHRTAVLSRGVRQFLDRAYLELYASEAERVSDLAGPRATIRTGLRRTWTLSADRLPLINPKELPKQENGHDCGPYVAQFVESLVEARFLLPITDEDVDDRGAAALRLVGGRRWFSPNDVARRRDDLWRAIARVVQDQSCSPR